MVNFETKKSFVTISIKMQSAKKSIIGGLMLFDILLALFFLTPPVFVSATSQKTAQEVFRVCRGVARYEECLGEEFAKVMEARGFAFMSETMLGYQELDPMIRGCHVIAHETTQAFMRKFSVHWKDILRQIDPGACGGGFMHGVLEARLGDDPNFNVGTDSFEEICHEIFQETFLSTNCAHILGHIIFVEKEGNLKASLKVCRGLAGETLFHCFSGIFMEDSVRMSFSDHGLEPEPTRDRQWFLRQYDRCREYAGDEFVEGGCFFDLAGVAAEIYGFRVAPVYDVCMTAHWPLARERCYLRSSVIIIIASPPDANPNNFDELCEPNYFDVLMNNRCIRETVSGLLDASLVFVPRGIGFCNGKSGSYQEECFNELSRQIHSRALRKDVRIQFCNTLPAWYQEQCRA